MALSQATLGFIGKKQYAAKAPSILTMKFKTICAWNAPPVRILQFVVDCLHEDPFSSKQSVRHTHDGTMK